MKEGCQEGYQQGVAAEARRTRQSGDGQYGGKAIRAEEKQNRGIPKK